jgi:phosphoribosyl-ATP pyrophosphohydrolase
MSTDVLSRLAETIHQRRSADSEKSYTKQMLDAGPARCARKFGEEAIELVIAAASDNDAAVDTLSSPGAAREPGPLAPAGLGAPRRTHAPVGAGGKIQAIVTPS